MHVKELHSILIVFALIFNNKPVPVSYDEKIMAHIPEFALDLFL